MYQFCRMKLIKLFVFTHIININSSVLPAFSFLTAERIDHITIENILSTSIYPHTWKLANVTPIFKKMINN